MADTIKLHCEIGNHDWERPKQRGKRPKSCPDHKPQPERVPGGGGSRVLSDEHKRKMQEGKAQKKAESDAEGIKKVTAFQDWVRRDVEFRIAHASGVITRSEMKSRIGHMPVIPRKSDWEAAGMAVDEGVTL